MPQIPGLSKALSHQSEARELITAMWDSIVYITLQIYIEPSLEAYRLREREGAEHIRTSVTVFKWHMESVVQ